MNKESFYREIGNIDDDLILEAATANGKNKKNTVFYRIAAAAACLCLVCGVIIFHSLRDSVYINNIDAPTASKLVVPTGDDVEILSMTYGELLEYYEAESLPSVLGKDIIKTEQSYFVIYSDRNGNILCDTNILYYSDAKSDKTISIMLAKADDFIGIQQDTVYSKVGGSQVALGKSQSGFGYWADFEEKETSVRVFAEGLSQEEFIDVIKELTRVF